MAYKIVIFDLDGTLLNTLDDLTASVNTLLERYNFPLHTPQEVSTFIGHGATHLLKKALPVTHQDLSHTFMDEFLAIYIAQNSLTTIYPGIANLLDQLVDAGVRLALYTNKPASATNACLHHHLHAWTFAPVFGQELGTPPKPHPWGILETLNYHHASPNDAVYVGDSDVDVTTAHNAGVRALSVTWGFRSTVDLLAAGATDLVHSPEELCSLILTTENKERLCK